MTRASAAAFAVSLLVLATPATLTARESLGMFSQWGAFADPAVPRCYAIAMAEKGRGATEQQPFASVGTWPAKAVRGQVSFRLSRAAGKGAAIGLAIGRQRFRLIGSGHSAWAADARMDAAIVAAMRSNPSMSVTSLDTRFRRFSDRYLLEGAASALDAATVNCARRR